MLQSRCCGRLLLGVVVFWLAAPRSCLAADPPAVAKPADDELALLLKRIRAAHDAVFSGEFLEAEVIEQETDEGVQRRVFNEVRGVFDCDRGRTRRRHELRRTRTARAPLDRCLVVETEANQAVWMNTGMIELFHKSHAYFLDEQRPVDPLALGFLGPVAEPQSFAQFVDFLAAHAAKGHVSVRREAEGYLLSIETQLVPHDILEKVAPGTVATRLRRITINSNLGFVPTRTTLSFLDKNGKETMRPITADVTWEKRGEVAVPVVVRTYQDCPKLWEERRTIAFTWKSVNRRIPDGEFNYEKFPVPAGTVVFDSRQHPTHAIGRIGN
jgi:hypothetical protein